MSRWTGVVTNRGAALLNEWVRGGTLWITGAASGDGTVPQTALLAQSDLSGVRRTASIAGYRKIDGGTQIRIQIAASKTEGYTLRQLGIWAAMDSDENSISGQPVLLALFQAEADIQIPSEVDSPDFTYTFYGAVAMDNTGNFRVNVDTSAIVSIETLRTTIEEAINELKLEIMTNELTLPLAATSGEPLLTSAGTPVLAVYHPRRNLS